MNYLKYVVITLIILVFPIGYFVLKDLEKKTNFQNQRDKIISEMNFILAETSQKGDYKCCIDPPCKMCFLGNWIFEDGKCNCDKFIAENQWDKVCPECKHGIEKGECESSLNTCSIEI